MLAQPKRVAQLYLMEEDFTKKWSMCSVDAAVSYLNSSLMRPVDNITVFKETVCWTTVSSRHLLLWQGAALQPVVAVIRVFNVNQKETALMWESSLYIP